MYRFTIWRITIGYPHTLHEQELWNQFDFVAGVDEAGRGALAGPVVAAAVILPKQCKGIEGVRDSKQLSHSKRESVFDVICNSVVSYGVGIVEHDVIDEINILQATFLAMQQAILALPKTPQYLLIDGNRFAQSKIPFNTIIGGDDASLSIAAASVLAKVTRDRIMEDLDTSEPRYCFGQNKGYGTTSHRNSIIKFGASPVHRVTFLRKLYKTQYNIFGEL